MQNKGQTALIHTIAMRSYNEANFKADVIKTIQLLITAGTDVNLQAKYGETALMCAAGSEQEDTVQLLIDAGADLTLRTQNCKESELNGKTSLDAARIVKNDAIVKILEDAAEKAKINRTKKT